MRPLSLILTQKSTALIFVDEWGKMMNHKGIDMTKEDFELFEDLVDEFRRSIELIVGNCENVAVQQALMELLADCARAEEAVYLQR